MVLHSGRGEKNNLVMGYVFGAACPGLSCLSYAQHRLVRRIDSKKGNAVRALSTAVAACSLCRMPLSMTSSTQLCVGLLLFFLSQLTDFFSISPSKTTNHPQAHLLQPSSDTMSPNLSQAISAPSTSIPTDDSYNALKTGSGDNIYQKEFGNIQMQGKFQCINAHVAVANEHSLSRPDKSYRHVTAVDMLSDDILLEMFGFILSPPDFQWKWRRLLHVCRRWRQIIFSSPLHLDLQLLCTFGTPVRKCLGYWPAFPLVIDYSRSRNKSFDRGIALRDMDDIFAALEQCDRVRHINLSVSSSLMAYLFAVMEEPFPALTHLLLSCTDPDKVRVLEDEDENEDGLVIPSKFLGGSATRLHEISLFNIPFPTIPAILSSASGLVKLQLQNVPRRRCSNALKSSSNGKYSLRVPQARCIVILPHLYFGDIINITSNLDCMCC